MTILTIDASKRSIPWALWRGETLTGCGHLKGDLGGGWPESARRAALRLQVDLRVHIHRVFVELPRIYPKVRTKDPNDLVDLAAAAGVMAVLGPLEFVHPRTWKGTVPKKVMTQRILSRLTPDELELVARHEATRPRAKSEDADMVDAIGVGLWKMGRLG